jgi:tryptophanyl-tRNA synthetase
MASAPRCLGNDEAPRTALWLRRRGREHANESAMFLQRQALRRAASSRLCANCLRQYSSAPSSGSRGENEPPKVIFSGIQPTGVPHLGNYLGALREWVKLQNTTGKETKRLFCVVDLHAITIKQDRRQLAQWRKEMLASLMAVGLNNQDSTLFCQSAVPQHAELMWILSCSASMGYLSRMTQWKVTSPLPSHHVCRRSHCV